jgi:hypothetical protein
MNAHAAPTQWLARSLPSLLFIATIIDDPLFGGMIIAARIAFGTTGLVLASAGFVALSIAMAAATAWALQREPLRLSPRNRDRIDALQNKRLGKFLIPHPERPVTTALAAVIFGSVAPMIVAALNTGQHISYSYKMALVSGVAYGLAFAAGYGLLGALVGVAA